MLLDLRKEPCAWNLQNLPRVPDLATIPDIPDANPWDVPHPSGNEKSTCNPLQKLLTQKFLEIDFRGDCDNLA